MKRKVKYKNFNRTLTVALLGDYSQNVPKSERTQVKNVPLWSLNLLKWGQNLPKWSQNVPIVYLYNFNLCTN